MPYVNNRWLGGLLTNWVTVQKSVKRLKELDEMSTDGRYDLLPRKKSSSSSARQAPAGEPGRHQEHEPASDIMFVIDSSKEAIAVERSRKLGIRSSPCLTPNCDPSEVDYVIPGNERRSARHPLFTSKISESIVEA